MTPARIIIAGLALLGLSFITTNRANADGGTPDTPSNDCEYGTTTAHPCLPPPDAPIVEQPDCIDGYPIAATITIPDTGYAYQIDAVIVAPGVHPIAPGPHTITAHYDTTTIGEWAIDVGIDLIDCPTTTTTTTGPEPTTTAPAPPPPTPIPAAPGFLG